MQEENPAAPAADQLQTGDILFDCPHCGKSLAIAPAGRGLVIPCTDCGRHVQVPLDPDDDPLALPDDLLAVCNEQAVTIRQLDAALSAANAHTDAIRDEKDRLAERCAYLETLAKEHAARLDALARTLESLQTPHTT